MVPQNEMPPILQTSVSDNGAPADHIQQIEQKYQKSTPEPRLKSTDNSNGGSGGSGGGN
jgi:hypothetical protein